MALAYLLLAFWVVGHHIERLPEVFMLIIRNAFGLQEAAGGAAGYGVAQAMTQGIQRGYSLTKLGWGLHQMQRHLRHLIHHILRLKGMYRCLVYLWTPSLFAVRPPLLFYHLAF